MSGRSKGGCVRAGWGGGGGFELGGTHLNRCHIARVARQHAHGSSRLHAPHPHHCWLTIVAPTARRHKGVVRTGEPRAQAQCTGGGHDTGNRHGMRTRSRETNHSTAGATKECAGHMLPALGIVAPALPRLGGSCCRTLPPTCPQLHLHLMDTSCTTLVRPRRVI